MLNQVEGDPSTFKRYSWHGRNYGNTKINNPSHIKTISNASFPFLTSASFITCRLPIKSICREMLQRTRNDYNFFQHILWTDKCSFSRIGMFNIPNLHYWAMENPRAIRADRFQHQVCNNLWVGIINGTLIGPFAIPRRLNGANYHNFLQDDLNIYIIGGYSDCKYVRICGFSLTGLPLNLLAMWDSFLAKHFPTCG